MNALNKSVKNNKQLKNSVLNKMNYFMEGVFDAPPGGSGAWQTKLEIVSQFKPDSPIELSPMQSPSFAGSFCGIKADARSPSQLAPLPSTFFIEV